MSSGLLRGGAALALAIASLAAWSQDEPKESDKLRDFLSDLGPGPVSAAAMLGVSASAVTDVQGPKDLNFLVNPGSDGRGTAFGVQIAPLRTQWSPISVTDYVQNRAIRLLSSMSLSYAENTATYSGVEYKQNAKALHFTYYLGDGDPIVGAHKAFRACKPAQGFSMDITQGARAYAEKELTATPDADLGALMARYKQTEEYQSRVGKMNAAVQACINKAVKASKDRWNAPLIAATVGSADISPASGGARLTLARTLSLSATFQAGATGGINLLYRRARKELDVTTIGATPVFSDRNFAAARYTHRWDEEGKLFVIAEVSNARSSRDTVTDQAFKYALGVDGKLAEGFWLELRLGRAKSASGSGEESKALVNLKWSPVPTLPAIVGAPGPN